MLVVQQQNLDGPRFQMRDRIHQPLVKLVAFICGFVDLARWYLELLHSTHQLLALPCSEDVQRQVHRRSMQISRGRLLEFRGDAALQQLDENRLQHIFGVLTVAGDAIRGPIHQLPVLPEQRLEFLRQGFPAADCCNRHRLVRS
jgi:hypothetical protein